MLLDKYEQDDLLFNKNFKENAKTAGMVGYRGDLVLVKGEVADAGGRTKPPIALVRSGVVLEKDDKLALVAGFLDDLALLPTFVEKYKADFADDVHALFYVVNITKPMQVTLEGTNFVLIPLVEGVTWNEVIDELYLEKSDFKGQSSGEKIVTVWKAFADYKPKYDAVSYDDASAFISEKKYEARGAV